MKQKLSYYKQALPTSDSSRQDSFIIITFYDRPPDENEDGGGNDDGDDEDGRPFAILLELELPSVCGSSIMLPQYSRVMPFSNFNILLLLVPYIRKQIHRDQNRNKVEAAYINDKKYARLLIVMQGKKAIKT